MQENQKRNRISTATSIILVVLAIVADLLTLIPFVGILVGPIFWTLANIYFWKSGLGFINSKRLATSAISTVAELLPAIQGLPTITLGIVIILIMTRTEDKLGVSLTPMSGKGPHLNSNGVRQPTSPQRPVNINGTRAPGGGLPLK